MPNCEIHTAQAAVLTIGTKNYCEQCQTDIVAARARVDRHVEPKECFIWYEGGNRGWQPIPGGGSAHWVMHQQNRNSGRGPVCMLGCPIRVSSVSNGRAAVEIANVQVNDIYVSLAVDHTGLVTGVTPSAKAGGVPGIIIRHDSKGQGQVIESEFATYFKGQGAFYR